MMRTDSDQNRGKLPLDGSEYMDALIMLVSISTKIRRIFAGEGPKSDSFSKHGADMGLHPLSH
jgi:hypothetical protein